MQIRIALELEQWFDAYTRPYLDGGTGAYLLRHKYSHSRRVADEMAGLAADLGLPEGEVRMARTLGLLHDVGRFTQFRQYGTLRDAQSVNHAREGVRVLGEAGILAACEDGDRERLLAGVGHHNARAVPEGLDDPTRRWVCLIRDADKLDIMASLYEAWRRDEIRKFPELTLGIDLAGGVSEPVLAAIRARRLVAYRQIRSLADFYLTQVSWVYDLNVRPAFRRLVDRRLLEQVAETLPDDPAVREVVAEARAYAEARLEA